MKIIWCMIPEIWNATDRNFSHFGPSFTFPPTPSVTTPENKNLKKMKKTPGFLIILHKCTINDNHTIYGSWDMKCNRIFFAILGHFLPFYPTNRPKKENIKKIKKKPGNIILHQVYQISWSQAILFLRYGLWQM